MPIFGAASSDRLGPFVQLDLRADRDFSLGGSASLRAFLELQNAAARQNPEEFAYSSDWSQRRVISGLPPMALLGVEVSL